MNRDSLEMRSTVRADGTLRLELATVHLPEPGPGEVLVQVEAAPINPSDLGLMFGPADMDSLRVEGQALTARIPDRAMPALKARIDQPLPIGNEGAGTVVAAGPDRQDLIGKRVAMLGGAMYASLRLIAVKDCMVLPDSASSEQGAALFVNPLTALGFVETMRAEGHKAIVHAPAASNLGQMLVRICMADGIGLVNIVRSKEQAAMLRDLGAVHVADSSTDSFRDDLTEAIAATGATLCFDAIGGGETTSIVLNAMEAVAMRSMTSYDRYGSAVMKQGYIYGALDTGPSILRRGFGFSWSVGGWLLFHALQRLDPATVDRMRQRVLAEMTTTFASHYTARITLEQALQPDTVAAYVRKSTGAKFLLTPQKP
ncbi:zinc-binding dehydrogenase [Paracoccus benzoatiresistens]|uniref:Zinc-binding dehydrogenase n=1 Tax=Paracoccus benzoatiresistens TaxID=2997341 RepID=A0ABT4J899_9RHOB|nr:zinc-binding dehydrogenase [Paracoccus sp. EF6]MCZ0963345.1 zinc-binding dehydrogenase [Paracoccus sp. EF6]